MAVATVGRRENLTSFRAVPEAATLGVRLDPLRDLPGRWFGTGFNLIARPDFQGGNDIFVELNRTHETLDFRTIGSPIPNRGSAQEDIFLSGVHYIQQVSDASKGGALHIEPGIWLNIPRTAVPEAPASVARLACIPHGDAVNAQGRAFHLDGPPKIGPANTVPFQIGHAPPPPGTRNPFPEYDLATPTPFRTSPVPPGVTQAMISDPNTVLSGALAGSSVVETEVLEVSTAPGAVQNIPFIVRNADAASMSAIFWIERVQDPSGGTFMQLQYTQTVLLNFKTLSWPHVSAATLVRTF
jgi:hypothetical protein